MPLFGLTPDAVLARIKSSAHAPQVPSLKFSLLYGTASFTLISALLFTLIAVGMRWMYRTVSEFGFYAIIMTLFIALGICLTPLVIGPGRLTRFSFLFAVSFLLYTIGWVGSYMLVFKVFREQAAAFGRPMHVAEFIACLIGPALFGIVLALGFGNLKAGPKLSLALIVTHGLGYLTGALVHYGYFLKELFPADIHLGLTQALWGIPYGLGFGLGLSYAIYVAQAPIREKL